MVIYIGYINKFVAYDEKAFILHNKYLFLTISFLVNAFNYLININTVKFSDQNLTTNYKSGYRFIDPPSFLYVCTYIYATKL